MEDSETANDTVIVVVFILGYRRYESSVPMFPFSAGLQQRPRRGIQQLRCTGDEKGTQ